MVKNWDTYTRHGIDLASAATTYGFSAAKSGTRFGFSVTRGIVTTAVGFSSTVLDHALFGGSSVARPVLEGAAISVISFVEQLTLAPIFLSEYITTTSLIAAHSSINALSVFFPGSSDASFSLASFITLVKREWGAGGTGAPEKQYGIMKIARGIVAWVALQGVTQEWQEKIWFKHLKEIHVKDSSAHSTKSLSRRNSRVRVTSDVIFPGNRAQIIAADIGEAPPRTHTHTLSVPTSPVASISRKFSLSHFGPVNHMPPFTPTPFTPTPASRPPSLYSISDPHPPMSNVELKSTLRRLSKIVLAGYGGASLLFFGVSPWMRRSATSAAAAMASEEAQLAHAISASEAEAVGEANESDSDPQDVEPEYSWWDVLLGKHDQEIFERAAGVGSPSERAKEELKAKMNATAVIGSEHMMPRFWVLTDHGRAQVVLVLRGTMSLNEIAADLTCEPEDFEPAASPDLDNDAHPNNHVPGRFPFPSAASSSSSRPYNTRSRASSFTGPLYYVHSGMLRMARAMGDPGKPVQLAVREALYHNPDYELVLCGHSLGAGVAAILGMMWADPRTCMTVEKGGLPPGRRVSVYCFAPPALADAALSKLASRLITSFVYSHDVVSRLSLGSVRDLKNAALWLCEAEQEGGGEGWGAVTTRAKRWTDGAGEVEDPRWFIAVRKTLEANMQMSNMFPPGRVLWAMRDSDLHSSHRSSSAASSPALPSSSPSPFFPSPSTSSTSSSSSSSPSTSAAGTAMTKTKTQTHHTKIPTPHAQDKLRLFEVLDVEKVFSQLVFARDMLTAHMPHQYDKVLHDLL